ncbi:uncharacterized protein LOC6545162 isoform X6 [Drosophila erecta]|uniref:uncharacterized protein LOC6545162 isoform X6 n=1 Tax=Drosophila erecta TaxID=7220 RepID=UPI000F06693E|nr:uncharacterized protein LOC6545162 isoform X6 [Drosophila erecta]
MEMQQESETGGEGVVPKPEKEVALISNQETEKAAMLNGGKEGSARDSESPNETATTTRNKEHTTKPLKLDGIFAMPATPPNKAGLTTKSASSSRSSSLKKQRRGSRGGANLNVAGTVDGAPKSSAPGGGQLNYGNNSAGNDLMKQSQSMTSLQASNEEQQESRDVIQAKLHLERPYNSLKKNSHSNKMHRYSWGSGNSQCSSTSLHSSATLGLSSSGKDDLWAAIQTNYNYIMDTNLLDTCKEARCEIEGAATVLEKSSECCFKMLDETQRPEGLCEDPKELRRWLREMENKLESSPTITELTLFGNAELQRHLAVHSVLYHEIASHARVVSSCIQAAKKEQQLQQQQQQQQQQLSSQQPASLTSNCSSESTSESATKSSSLSSGFASDPLATPIGIGTAAAAPPPSGTHPSKKGEGNLERLRDRYHLLYLKAFELQLCLDNLLSKRSSTATGLDDDEDEEEDTEDDSFGYEGEATEDDLNEVNSDLDLENSESKSATPAELILQRCQIAATQIVCGLDEIHSQSQSRSQQVPSQAKSPSADQPRDCLAPQKPGDEADEELEEEDEDEDPDLGTDVVDFLIAKRSWRQASHPNPSGTATLTDFEADSESSDFEQVQQLSRRGLPPTVGSTRRVLNLIEMPQSSNSNTNSSNSLLQQRNHNIGSKMLPNKAHGKNIAVAVITPNSHGNTSHGHGLGHGLGHELNKSPLGLRKTRHHHNDTSKFNRSNRKSKNCAIFYFKHLDTDNEQGNAAGSDLQSEDDPSLIHRRRAASGGDILKSADASTDDDDEGWLYTATAAATLEVATAATAAPTAAAATAIVDGLQSTAISSTTATGGPLPPSDDSDKENKVALVSATATATATATSIATLHGSSYDSSSACSSSNSHSNSNSNSNGRLTETSATSRVTQLQMQIHSHSQSQSQMELQINGNAIDGRHIISNNNCYSSMQHQPQNNNEGEAAEDLAKIKMGVDEAAAADLANGNAGKSPQISSSLYSRADTCNFSVWAAETVTSCHLPPRSPAKSAKSSKSQASNATMSASTLVSPAKGKVSHDSIKQLVLEAEHLVRDAQETALKTPTKQKHSIIKISSTVKKREVTMPHPIKQRVEEWLEHQPSTPQLLTRSHTHELLPSCKPDDCEASGEASETDSVPQAGAGVAGGAPNGAGSDSSEGFTDSIATCMQTSTNSYGNSTERIGGSAEPIGQPVTPLGFGSSNQSLNVKIVKRTQTRRKSERPWSVSCLSQLTTDAAQLTTARIVENSPPGLASHSISESALDSLSPGPRPRAASSSGTGSNAAKKADSKGSLRRRKARKKRISAASAGRKSDSGSELGGDLTQTLMKSCESMSSQQLQEFTNALLSIQKGAAVAPLSPKGEASGGVLSLAEGEGEGAETQLMLPKFRVGSFTTAGLLATDTRLGALAALSNYMNEDEQQAELSTEDHHSSISETAWDNYQEKYNSENYSEGFDSDAARRLLEFGDDYRNFIDSQSDCCSSLSAANNLDSFSPPRMDSLQKHELKTLHINQDTITSSVDHARRQRALELQYERRRKTLEVRRKSCQDMDESLIAGSQSEQQQQQLQVTPSLSASATALMTTPKNQSISQQISHRAESVGRKLDFGGMSHSAQSLLRRTSESDTSTRRRRTVTADERRRSSRNLEKCIKLIPATTSSSSGSDSEDGEQEMRSLLQQSRDRLDDTRALKIRCHLLRPEDYNEIINTCRDNIRCLEAVLRGPPGTVLSNHCAGQTKVSAAVRRRRRRRPGTELPGPAEPSGDSRQMAQVVECQCAPITRFVARVIEFVLDVGNMLEHFALYRFLAGTLRSLYELVDRPVGGRLGRFFVGLRGLF